MQLTNLEERIPLIPLITLQMKRYTPILSNSRSYFYLQQSERKDWTMKAPPKASDAKRMLRLMIVPMFSWDIPAQLRAFLSAGSSGSIFSTFIMKQQINPRPPSKAYILTTLAMASNYEPQLLIYKVVNIPQMADPAACERYPAILQYPNTFDIL